MSFSSDVPTSQRALVLQGGGALGAYEAGAYSVLYESLSKRIRDNENIFDVIAGTSIGAMNAAVIISHVVHNGRKHPSWSTLKCWEGSAETNNFGWITRKVYRLLQTLVNGEMRQRSRRGCLLPHQRL